MILIVKVTQLGPTLHNPMDYTVILSYSNIQALGLRASVMEHAGSRLRPVPWRAQAPLVVRTGFDA